MKKSTRLRYILPLTPAPTYACVVLIVIAALNFIRGFLHVFLPDSGAGSIAHLDLSTNAQNIIFLIATIGVRQVAIGLFQLLIAFRARQLVFHAFTIDLILLLLPRFFDKPPASIFPGVYAHDIELGVVLIVLVLMIYKRIQKYKLKF